MFIWHGGWFWWDFFLTKFELEFWSSFSHLTCLKKAESGIYNIAHKFFNEIPIYEDKQNDKKFFFKDYESLGNYAGESLISSLSFITFLHHSVWTNFNKQWLYFNSTFIQIFVHCGPSIRLFTESGLLPWKISQMSRTYDRNALLLSPRKNVAI